MYMDCYLNNFKHADDSSRGSVRRVGADKGSSDNQEQAYSDTANNKDDKIALKPPIPALFWTVH